MVGKIKYGLIRALRFIRVYQVKKRVASYKGRIFVGGSTKLTRHTYLGNNVSFNGLKVVGHGRLVIGDNFHSGNDCLIITSNHNYKGEKLPYDETHIIKEVIIEDNVWVGSRVIILGGVTVGEGAIIQAGAMVHKDIPKCAIVGGNPAKIIAYRDIEKYWKLKKEGRFH